MKISAPHSQFFRFVQSGLLLSFLFLTAQFAPAQFTTAVQDGVISANEYGVHTNGQNQQTDGGTTYFMGWDANNLYVAFSGSNYNEAQVLYLDFNPFKPVNGGTNADGSVQGLYTYDRNHMMLPFRADFVLYYKNGYNEYRRSDGSGYWTGNTAYTLTSGNNGGTNTCEIAIPWNTITSGSGRPAQFNWLTYKTYDYGPSTNGIYNSLPVGNPNCACNQDPSRLFPTRYYNVLNTNNGTATKPFSTVSFNYYENYSAPGVGGYYLNGGTFYDFTINDNSTDNTDNDPVHHVYDNNEISNRVLIEGAITVANDLYVGQGSALLPANNSPSPVTATMTFTGASGRIYNFGRIDPNPEASVFGDWNNRRVNFVFAGTTRLMPSNVFKDRWRMSNVTVNSGATLLRPLVDSVSVEWQFGTFNNLGTIDFGDGTSGFADVGTRGDWPQQNDYALNGTGIWKMHGVLIGRNSSKLQPSPGGTVVRLLVQGDFENYDEFLGKLGAARIDVVMAGKLRQYLKGNTAETTGATTSFYNLEIDNDNGLSNNNNTADVFFQSYGGGTIQYFVNGQLTLTRGDLTTRDRSSGVLHNLTLRDSASVSFGGARSNIGTNGSCFVDGPLRYEVENAAMVTRQFPVGKSKVFTSYQWGDYRHLQLEVQLDAPTKTTFSVEMFLDDRSMTYAWPSPIPEVISWISPQRYWNVTKVAGANVVGAFVTLSYDQVERTDGVINAPALRVVKDDGAGNWVNITPLGPGGSANSFGTIRSHAFFSFSDFTLASVDAGQPLPVEFGEFEVSWQGAEVRLDWKTMSEANLARFVVEASTDGENFEAIARVDAVGNSMVSQAYQAWDVHPDRMASTLYYRLRLEDLNGSVAYSEVRALQNPADEGASVQVFPNPAQDAFTILVTGLEPEAIRKVALIDMMGRTVWEQPWPIGQRQLGVPVGPSKAGIYTAVVCTKTGLLRVPVIVR